MIGGWQYSAATRWYSGRPLIFSNSYLVTGNPKLDNPTQDRWFDTSMFGVADAYTPRSNPFYYDQAQRTELDRMTDMTLTKMFSFSATNARLEARVEAYNAFNTILWDTRIWSCPAPISARSRASAWTETAAKSRSGCGSSSRPDLRKTPGRDTARSGVAFFS